MRHLQTRVASFVAQHRIEAGPAHRLLDAVSEIGEVAKEVLKSSRYGSKPFARSREFDAELGDVMFSLLCLANAAGVDLETAVDDTLRKYAQRIAVSGTPGSEP